MTTPPRPERSEYDAPLCRIHQRRRAAGDDHPLALSEDPREVLAYLRRRGRNGLVVDDTGDDIIDALTLRLWLWWEGEATELWLLEAAEALGRNRLTIGATLGLSHGQSLVDRIRRNQERFDRTPAAAGPVVAESGQDAAIRELALDLVNHHADMPDEIADDLYVDQLAEMLSRWPAGAPVPSDGVLNALRFLLGDLADAVPAGTRLRAVVDHGVRLVGTRHAPIV